MKEIILCKYGEIVLKGANKKYFEDMLCREMRKRAKAYGNFDIYRAQSTIYIEPLDDDADFDGMFEAARKVFGIHPSYDSFTLNPCIPADWKEISVRRKFRGDTYLITVKNPNGKQSGASSVTVDGQPSDAKIKIFGDGKEHVIEVIM